MCIKSHKRRNGMKFNRCKRLLISLVALTLSAISGYSIDFDIIDEYLWDSHNKVTVVTKFMGYYIDEELTPESVYEDVQELIGHMYRFDYLRKIRDRDLFVMWKALDNYRIIYGGEKYF